ncbi:MAG: DEAD/DEAH box helicase [Planctomycetes bacterium]|jgi:ATP-dependent DNA helicase RecG|nr:DEAD/DEAH box helicase [Planctomycetota bacterium]
MPQSQPAQEVACPQSSDERAKAPLTTLAGIGPKRAEIFAREWGVQQISQLLTLVPKRFQIPAEPCALDALQDGAFVRISATVKKVWLWGRNRRRNLYVQLENSSGGITAVWFQQPFLRSHFEEGAEVELEGKVSQNRGWQLLSPRVIHPGELQDGRPIPEYPSAEGLPAKIVAKAVAAAIECLEFPAESLPTALLKEIGLPPLPLAWQTMHSPESLDQLEPARRRLALAEIIHLERRRRKVIAARVDLPTPIRCSEKVWQRIYKRLPFELTSEQKEVLQLLRGDLAAETPMRRLLHGEVGSGKTAVAFAIALAVAAEGGQVALLAPTEILARQHLATFRKWLEGSRLKVVGLFGDDKAPQRLATRADLLQGRAQIAIGTHALFSGDIDFQKLQLVLFDEQHRFGVKQKGALVAKGKSPHVLTMTATPIPRTLAWAQHGALEPCVLRQRAGTSATVSTHIHDMGHWPTLAREMRKRIEKGEQAFVVVPRIDGEDGLTEVAKALTQPGGLWHGIPCAVVNGRLPSEQVESRVRAFRDGAARVLLGTTVVEVGLDVPGVTLMAILSADRLGLASLHQLRGRLSRGAGAKAGSCWMLGSPDSIERLQLLETHTDGFQVAELDLRMRGAGALRGVRQSGRSDFQVFQPLKDADLVALLRDNRVTLDENTLN